jgi:2'-5' RNA ligase
MPRLFIGLEIPPLQRTALTLGQSGLPDTRWIELTDFHITLRFIGDVSPKQADTIVEALDSRDWTAPHIAFDGLAVFGKSKPKSLYARVVEDEALMRLAASLERMMQRLGLEPNPQKFTPHVTLARFRSAMRPEAVANYLDKSGPLAAPAFTPERFVLYSARESTGGGPYVAEEAFGFRAPSLSSFPPVTSA